ncbi:MAG TPA: MBL fold metallo-hydrolase, partial [Steroidobacteraceae bacterium]|nr:MBL fold metallo-hydrolase [Steroidobacteraceae bacterium]
MKHPVTPAHVERAINEQSRLRDRRAFLHTALGSVAAASVAQWIPLPAHARQKAAPLTATKLNDRVTVVSGAGANVVAISGPEGALLVDGGLEARSGELLKLALKETGAKRVHTLVNTHWHPEQTGSNARLGKAGAKIFAHENTKLWLGYANPVPLTNETYGPLPPKALPNETTFGMPGTLDFGGQKVEYGYLLQAHTDGDLYVFLPESNVLVAGGVVSGEGWPVIDYQTGGWIGGLVAGLKTLLGVGDANTQIVPANGPVLKRA